MRSWTWTMPIGRWLARAHRDQLALVLGSAGQFLPFAFDESVVLEMTRRCRPRSTAGPPIHSTRRDASAKMPATRRRSPACREPGRGRLCDRGRACRAQGLP